MIFANVFFVFNPLFYYFNLTMSKRKVTSAVIKGITFVVNRKNHSASIFLIDIRVATTPGLFGLLFCHVVYFMIEINDNIK